MEWISVKDKLPPTGRNRRLMVIDSEAHNEHQKAHFEKGKFFHGWDYACFYPVREGRFTHWMELPEPKK